MKITEAIENIKELRDNGNLGVSPNFVKERIDALNTLIAFAETFSRDSLMRRVEAQQKEIESLKSMSVMGERNHIADIICEWDSDVWRKDAEALADTILSALSSHIPKQGECPKCDGSGNIEQDENNILRETCPNCNGSGKAGKEGGGIDG